MEKDCDNVFEDDIAKGIYALERRDLDLVNDHDLTAYMKSVTNSAFGDYKFEFLRVKAVSRALSDKKSDVERFLMEDVLSGLNGLKAPFVYLIIGSKFKVSVYLGILNKSTSIIPIPLCIDMLSSSLESTFPDIDLEVMSDDDVENHITHYIKNCSHYGIMTGIPTAKIGVEEHGVEQIERLLRGLSRQEYGYMVIAEPVQDSEVVHAYDDIANVIREKSPYIKELKQFTQTSRVTLSGETLNRPMQYYVELLELLLEKLRLAKAQGLWRTGAYYFSSSQATVDKMSGLLRTVFSGEKSVPESIRTIALNSINPSAILIKFRQIELALNYHPAYSSEHPLRRIIKHKFSSVLNSRDLATLTHLPKEEMPGYDVKDTARFGVSMPDMEPAETFCIGEIVDRGRGTGNHYEIYVKELVKHGLIAGVTGSGKTNTCLKLLDQLWKGNSGIPFLVIEPAKAEYRFLLNEQGYEDLQVFTLGDEMTSSFRLNPFEIIKGVKLQTHIDNLKAVFNASFVMYAPMPYVLERCIHEVYKDKGWDLTTNLNRFDVTYERNPYGIFPTLTDLNEKIDSVVDAMGYEDRITMDIKAGLKARIDSLRIGGKGAMLDTALSIPMDQLLAVPTILELQCIGDDEEKAFIIGLIIARLYEYRQIESKCQGSNSGLKHVTLIEEAHRLLTKTSSDFSNLENVSTKAKAVEVFCNILSEIRAFGEGILIAEQIPSKLAQDAVKNTNMKVMHRIVAKDDRDLMGDTMNLDEKQKKYVSIMPKGEAVVFSEGFNEPFLVMVSHYQSSMMKVNPSMNSIQDKDVNRFMAKNRINIDHIFGRYAGCKQCQCKCSYRDTINYLLSMPETIKYFQRFFNAIIEKADNLAFLYPSLKDIVLKEIRESLKTEVEVNDCIYCFLINAGESFVKNKARQYFLPSEKSFQLLNAYNNCINSYFSIPLKTQLSANTDVSLKELQRCNREIFLVNTGPFPGCNEFCTHKCFFRYNVGLSLKDKSIDEKLLRLIQDGGNGKANVRDLCLSVAQDLTLCNSDEFVENVALCFFIQKSLQWSVKEVLLNIDRWFVN